MKKFIHIIIFLLVIPVLFSCSKNQTHYKPGTYVSLDTIIARRTIENERFPSAEVSIERITYLEYTKNDKLNNVKSSSDYYNLEIFLYDIELEKWNKINFKINHVDLIFSHITWSFEENANVDCYGSFTTYGDEVMEMRLSFDSEENRGINQYWFSLSDEDCLTKEYKIKSHSDFNQPNKLIIEETDKIVNDENDLLLLESDEYCTIYSNKVYRYRFEGKDEMIYYVKKIETTPFYYNDQKIWVESGDGDKEYYISLSGTNCEIEQTVNLNGH